jgi:HSP20 family molecular chaperone IbpA
MEKRQEQRPAEGQQNQPQAQAQRQPMIQTPVDIYESKEEFLLIADVPGVKDTGLKVRLERNELMFEATRVWNEEGRTLFHDQRDGYGYTRRFTVPGGIDSSRVTARTKDGVLYIHLPKSEQLKAREIPVRAS